jgi:hypothetical protein
MRGVEGTHLQTATLVTRFHEHAGGAMTMRVRQVIQCSAMNRFSRNTVWWVITS